MINYSTVMRGNPADKSAPKKAFATAQYSDVMELDEFARHIASHGCVYSRADIAAVLTLAVDCIHEQLLAGQKIQLGDLGSFSVSLLCKGAESADKFNPAINVSKVKVKWTPGTKFNDLTEGAEFNLVATRAVQAKVNAAIKAGATTVDISKGSTSSGGDDKPSGGGSGEEGGGGIEGI